MTTAPLPNTTVQVLGPDGQFTLPWRRWFQQLPGAGSGSGLPGPPGPSGPSGPAGPPGASGTDLLSIIALSGIDGSNGVISVGLSAPAEFIVTGSPVTGSGTLVLTKATETANTIWAGPTTGAAAVPTFRALVGADLPNPTSSTLGGIESFAAVSHQWINQISTSGVPSATQPSASDLSDTVLRTTFTPTVSFNTPGDLSVAYTTQTGAYVKVGPMVLFWISLAFTPTYTTASGSLIISRPPPTITDLTWAWPVRQFSTPTWPAGSTQIVASNYAAGILIGSFASGVALANFSTTQITSGTAYTLIFSGFYF